MQNRNELRVGVVYTTHAQKPATASRFRVVEYIDEGVLARVWRLERLGSDNQLLGQVVAKVPKNSGDSSAVEEYMTLDALNRLLGVFTPLERMPVPRMPELHWFEDPHGGDSIMGLVMEYILPTVPQLDDHYSALMKAAERPLDEHERERRRLETELLAWMCAITYMDVIEAGFGAGIVTTDRKADTFRWDTTVQRLIVMDWNKLTRLEGSVTRQRLEPKVMRNFAQYWYSLMTEFQAEAMLPMWQTDERWRGMTLFGRAFLRDYGTVSSGTVSSAKIRLNEFVSELHSALRGQWSSLELKVQEEKSRWQKLNNLQKTEQGAALLKWTDLARRVGDQTLRASAEAHYREARASILRVGEGVSTRGVPANWLDDIQARMSSSPAGSKTNNYYKSLYELLDNFRDFDRNQTQKVRFTLEEVIEELTVHLTNVPLEVRGRAVRLRETVERLKKQYTSATGTLSIQFTGLEAIIDFHERLVEFYQGWSSGSLSAARTALDALRPLATSEREQLLGISITDLELTLAQVEAAQNAQDDMQSTLVEMVAKLVSSFQKSIDMHSDRPLVDWLKQARVILVSPALSVAQQHALADLHASALTLRRIFAAHIDQQSRWDTLEAYVETIARYPRLWADLHATEFAQALNIAFNVEHDAYIKSGKAIPENELLRKAHLLTYLFPQAALMESLREGMQP